MTKLEQKLCELGYRQYHLNKNYYTTNFRGCVTYIVVDKGKIARRYIDLTMVIITQHDIDNIQQAFNQLQKDLKELKEYE